MPERKIMGKSVVLHERFLLFATLDEDPADKDILRFVTPKVTATITWRQLLNCAEQTLHD